MKSINPTLRWKLPAPVLPDALCRGHEEPLWDLDINDEDLRSKHQRHNQAKSICGECPHELACYLYANTSDPPVTGVWGGHIFRQGKSKH